MFILVKRYWPALFSLAILYAQSDPATVTGVVTDSASAVIPGVHITIRNTDTGIPHSIDTNGVGYFTITELSPGPYELMAEKKGFQNYRQTSITLETGQTLRTDVKLEIGSVNQTVTVTADVASLNTENGMVTGQVVTNSEIDRMPLNGRDFTELALYVPGVMEGVQGGDGTFAAINGARQDATNFLVDGVDDRSVRGASAQLQPNIDALQEFKMEVGGYSAEYGKMAGGILNMTLKSGTNQYHGSLFEYFRNTVFNSRSYFATSNLPFHQNQFGGVISGPLSIPGIYNGHDRTFFMFSWESLRNPWEVNGLGNVPTAAQRAGDFSHTVNNVGAPIILKNPFSSPANAPFPGDMIPASLFSPIAIKLIAVHPLPNRTAVGNNYASTGVVLNNYDSFVTRGDHRFSEKDYISVRYGKRFNHSNNPFTGTNRYLGLFNSPVEDDRSLGGLNYTHMFSPTLLADFRFGLSRSATVDTLSGNWPSAAQLGMPGSTTIPGLAGFPTVGVTNYQALGYASNEPLQYFVTNYSYGGKVTWIKGDHVMKAGVDISHNRLNNPFFNNSRGTVGTTGVWTGAGTAANGDAIADLELGLLGTSSIISQPANNYVRDQEYSVFLTDDWKITRSLTLNLGLRYEIDAPVSDLYGRMTNFIPQYGKIAVSNPANIPNFTQVVAAQKLQNLVVPASQLGLPQSMIYADYKDFAPRVGFAWRPFKSDRTVLRGGYGIFYTGSEINAIRNSLDDTFPVVLNQSFTRVASDPSALTLSNPWNQSIASLTGTTTSAGYELHAPVGYLQSYSLKLEREVGRAVVVEAGFVGSKGTHLGQEYNLNQPVRTIAGYEQTGTFPAPYPQLGTITYLDFRANSIYNSGQFTLRRRSTSGFFYRLSYTYSKSIDDTSQFNGTSSLGFNQALDPNNLGLDRARSDWDRGHVVQAVFSWPLPLGRGQALLKDSGRVVNGIVGRWQLAGTSIFETGPPMTIEDSSINANIGESARPNRIATGYDYNGTGKRGVDYPWFNPADFQPVPGCISRTNCSPNAYGFLPFQPGNAGRGILDAPGKQNINLTLLKSWPITERRMFQFRWEVFNIFNHPNFVLMDRNFNETAAGYLTSVAASGTGGPRIMQFALKYLF